VSVPVIAIYNNKGGVGKTTLVYHLGWMMPELGLRVLVADLDPQANVTAAFCDDETLEGLWSDAQAPATIFAAVRPLKSGVGDVLSPILVPISEELSLLPGDMSLSLFEDDLSYEWSRCLVRDEKAFRVTSAIWRVLQKGAETHLSDLVLLDLGPNMGAVNRAALIAADFVVIPLAPDLFSLQGLRNLGPRLRSWRSDWQEIIPKKPPSLPEIPAGRMAPLGYVVLQHSVRLDRPVKSYDRWIARIPGTYREFVLEGRDPHVASVSEDPCCIALMKHFRSLMPMAQEARKPIFFLKASDGALGAHTYAVKDAYRDFEALARKILALAGISPRFLF
jgi:chromosome partitioning protein